MAVLTAVTLGAPVAGLQAASGSVDIADITIVGTTKLHVEKAGTGAGYNAAWVTFRTGDRLHVVRQVVVEVRRLRGSSYTAKGARNCIRSTLIQGARSVTPGHTYRVRFYGRPGRAGKATTLIATRTVKAQRFASSRGNPRVPGC